MGMGDLII